MAWASRHGTAKPDTTEGLWRKHGGRRGKVAVLIRGDLAGCRFGAATRPTARAATPRVDLSGVSRGRCTGGGGITPGRAERQARGHACASHRPSRPQPTRLAPGPGGAGEAVNPPNLPPERSVDATTQGEEKSSHPARADELWERVFSRSNLSRALRRVEANAGAPGVDGMTTVHLRSQLVEHWPVIRQRLDVGLYRPAPVRRVTIPKPAGGHRELGVLTVLDRFIQQALLQVLQPVFDPTFSEHSYGLRPKRCAHMAVTQARAYVQDGKTWVVDVDLDRFFDRVSHDVLMARVSRRVGDRRVRRLIGTYLRAGVMADGVRMRDDEGTPQGSSLSPLLANVCSTTWTASWPPEGTPSCATPTTYASTWPRGVPVSAC